MIVRIVKMTFMAKHIDAFIELFESKKAFIRGFDGCEHLELWQDEHEQNIFFTYSTWQSETHLNHYRFSPLFKDIWSSTKILFADKAQAWSVNRKVIVETK